MNALTTKEMETLLGTVNAVRRKGKAKRQKFVLTELQEVLSAQHRHIGHQP